MSRYIELDAVLNYIPSGIKDEFPFLQLLSWALQGLNTIDTQERLERNIVLLYTDNHKVCLPDDVKYINSVKYTLNNPLECAKECECEDCIEQVDEECCCISINHRIFVESQLNTHHFMPMRYMGNSRHNKCHTCNDVYNINCMDTYTVDIDDIMSTSIQRGWICVDYMRVPKRAGSTIIPNFTDLLQGLGYYATAMSWLDRDSRKEQGAYERYEKMLIKAEILLRKFSGKIKLRHIDVMLMQDFVFGRNYLLKHDIAKNHRYHARERTK
jgi:hypothetical protein